MDMPNPGHEHACRSGKYKLRRIVQFSRCSTRAGRADHVARDVHGALIIVQELEQILEHKMRAIALLVPLIIHFSHSDFTQAAVDFMPSPLWLSEALLDYAAYIMPVIWDHENDQRLFKAMWESPSKGFCDVGELFFGESI